jgi:signal transduction histidine kinase/tetratricopeptide (TPR) repeat protein
VLSARRSLSLFLVGVVCLAFWQVWLTWRLMEQDRNLELQRSRERLEQIADLTVAQLARSLGECEFGLRELNSLPPPSSVRAKLPADATLILISQGTVTIFPRRPLLFVPDLPLSHVQTPHVFDAAEELEFREQQYDRAIAALQPLVDASATRPEALLRIARIERKAGRPEVALDAYRNLGSAIALNPSGTPYALLAANASYRILTELGRRQKARAEAESLRAGLLEGRWPLRREAFEYHWTELDRLGITTGKPPQSSFNFSVLVSELYDRWQGAIRAGSIASGRDPRPDSSLLLWNATSERLGALVTSANWLNSSLKLPTNSGDIRWRVSLPGAPPGNSLSVTRSLAEAQLPGRIEFFSSPAAMSAAYHRRSVWLAGVALMLMLVLAAAYAIHRGISQELRVARLQSDFVAAVSHEFRSPLTTLRTITELLAQDRIADESRRRQSYLFLDRETNRLHRLVEDLLDFGRMESGRKQYRIGAHDAFELVRTAVADFSEEAASGGFRVETKLGLGPATIQADDEAFRRAVRNLLENAIKYSPECHTVWVDGKVNDHQVSISVRDQGMGIDPREQREIFQKFVRGNAAKKAGIKGTGIGLSMVQQIIEALGGEIHVESRGGAGSTFTIVLPLVHY